MGKKKVSKVLDMYITHKHICVLMYYHSKIPSSTPSFCTLSQTLPSSFLPSKDRIQKD